MPVATRRQARILEEKANRAAPTSSPANLNSLPGELIMQIADHLHPILTRNVCRTAVCLDPELNDVAELQTGKQKGQCRCHGLKSSKVKKKEALPDYSTDYSVALASASRRLRHIVFDSRMNRYKPIRYCNWCMQAGTQISEQVKSNHMYVSRTFPSQDVFSLNRRNTAW